MTSKKDTTDIGLLEPQERLKTLISYSNAIEVDPHVPPRRYYRSGLEMVRMANVYLEEGNLENAYILYLKFMTLFLEKIKKHPDYASVSADEKSVNLVKLREILPKAEKLKAQLLERYVKEYNRYLEELKERELEERQKEAKRNEELKKVPQQPPHPSKSQDAALRAVNVKLPSIDSINYPDPLAQQIVPANVKVTPSAPSFDRQPSLSTQTPSVNRSIKPAVVSSSVSLIRSGLRTVIIPMKVMTHFLNLAQRNTINNIETCGILAGKLEKNELVITHMILPKQKGTADSCATMNEEEIFEYQDMHNLITIGWIHTHPTQTAFLSSVDLHTHCPYQLLMPEAIAIVCAPRYEQTGYFILTPTYGLDYIANCRKSGFHPHPTDPPLFMNAEHIKIDSSAVLDVLDLRS